MYFGFNAKSAVLYDHRILGELFKQVLPLTGELAKRTFGHKKDSPGKKERKKNLNISEDLRGNREYAMLSHSGVQGINILS